MNLTIDSNKYINYLFELYVFFEKNFPIYIKKSHFIRASIVDSRVLQIGNVWSHHNYLIYIIKTWQIWCPIRNWSMPKITQQSESYAANRDRSFRQVSAGYLAVSVLSLEAAFSVLWTLYGLESILMHYLHLGIELATSRATCHQRNRLTAAGCNLHVARRKNTSQAKFLRTQRCCCCCWYCCVICHLRPTTATPTWAQVTPTLRWNCCWSQRKICWLAQLDDYLNSEPATILLTAHSLSFSLLVTTHHDNYNY